MPFPGLLSKNTGGTGPTPPLTNLQVWWDASQQTGYTDGQQLDTTTNVHDFSGNGNTGIPTSQGNQALYKSTSVTINGLPVFEFTANGSWNQRIETAAPGSGGLQTNTWTEATVYVVGRRTADPTVSGISSGIWTFANNSEYDHGSAVPFTDGNVYDVAFSTVQKSCGSSAGKFASAYYYGVLSKNASWEARLNGASFFSTGTNTFLADAGNGSGSCIAFGWSEIPNPDGGGAILYDGVIGEFLVYDQVLNSTDRAALETYFHNKWGI